MSDLISRAMLLEYIRNEPIGRMLCDKHNLDGVIKQFPPAQPEIIRCKDCKYKFLDDMVWNCPFGLPGGENFFCGYGAKGGDDDDE